ncbi:MAG: LPD11 domain-containing protein [Enterococcus lemanii]
MDVLKLDETLRYQLLDRMRSDVSYVLRQAEAKEEDHQEIDKRIWVNVINNIFWGGQNNHFSTMKDLFNSFSEEKQPEWYSLSQMYADKRRLEEMIGFELG